MHKIGQSTGFLGRLLGPLLKVRLPLIGNVHKPLAKSFLVPLGLTAVASTTDAATHKRMFGYSTCPRMLASHLLDLAKPRSLITSNEEMNDITANS